MCLIEAIVFNILHIFFKVHEKMFTNSLLYAVWDVYFWVYSYATEWTKKEFPSSHLQLNLKQGRNVAEVGCESWGISLGWNSWLSPSFSWGKFSHVLSFEQLCLIKNIWWIITEQNNVHIFFNMYLSGLLKVFLDYHYKCCRHFVCAQANKINNSLEVWTWYVLSI